MSQAWSVESDEGLAACSGACSSGVRHLCRVVRPLGARPGDLQSEGMGLVSLETAEKLLKKRKQNVSGREGGIN